MYIPLDIVVPYSVGARLAGSCLQLGLEPGTGLERGGGAGRGMFADWLTCCPGVAGRLEALNWLTVSETDLWKDDCGPSPHCLSLWGSRCKSCKFSLTPPPSPSGEERKDEHSLTEAWKPEHGAVLHKGNKRSRRRWVPPSLRCPQPPSHPRFPSHHTPDPASYPSLRLHLSHTVKMTGRSKSKSIKAVSSGERLICLLRKAAKPCAGGPDLDTLPRESTRILWERLRSDGAGLGRRRERVRLPPVRFCLSSWAFLSQKTPS